MDACKRYTQPVVQTQPGLEFRIVEVPLFEDSKGKWVKWEDYEQVALDAARYRWLKEHGVFIHGGLGENGETDWTVNGSPFLPTLEEAIDAASAALKSARDATLSTIPSRSQLNG